MSSLGFGELLKGECQCGGDMAVTGKEIPDELKEILDIVCRHFQVFDFKGTEREAEAEVESQEPKRAFLLLSDELEKKGYIAALKKKGGGMRLLLLKFPPPRREGIWLSILLLMSTAITTLLAGMRLFGDLMNAFVLSSSLLAILGAHEAGHKLAAKKNGIEISNPYFIPAPPLLGTFGSVIMVKKPIRTKEAMMQMGFLGPLLGFILALLCMLLGLLQPAKGISLPMLPALFLLITRNPSAQLNPLLFSGCVMMMITAMNLLPAGQLDGGHIFRGLTTAAKHYKLTRTLGFVLLFTGFIFPAYPLWIWGLLILLFFGQPHPGALDDFTEVSKDYRLITAASIVILLLCMPIPTKL
jgi:hypothetical protein